MEIHWSLVAIAFATYTQVHMDKTPIETTCLSHFHKSVFEQLKTPMAATFLHITTPLRQLEFFSHNK
jgi:hypothetical protein